MPTGWDGTLLVTPSWVAAVAFPISGVAIPVAIPCDSSLCGFPIYLQALEIDPGASKGVSFTQVSNSSSAESRRDKVSSPFFSSARLPSCALAVLE